MCSFLGLPPTLPCALLVWHCVGQGHCALSHGVFNIHGWQTEMYLCALNSYTTVEDVIQCPEIFPLPPLPTCQNKYLIWKSRYRSQLDCTKGPVSFLLLLLLLFFNIISLMGWVTVYSRIKGWRRYFGISLSSSVFLLWNLGKFFCVCFGFFVYPLIWALYFPRVDPPAPPAFLSEMEERRNCVHVCVVPCQAEKLNRQPLLLLLSHL